jgi:ATPase subunit of ABC transporter with duplicated ATPase domains
LLLIAFRVIDAVIMGNKRLWTAMEERERDLFEKPGDDRRRRHEAGRTGRYCRVKKMATPPRADAAILLQGLDIPDELHLHERKMGELQGGQKVRVLLAQASIRSIRQAPAA